MTRILLLLLVLLTSSMLPQSATSQSYVELVRNGNCAELLRTPTDLTQVTDSTFPFKDWYETLTADAFWPVTNWMVSIPTNQYSTTPLQQGDTTGYMGFLAGYWDTLLTNGRPIFYWQGEALSSPLIRSVPPGTKLVLSADIVKALWPSNIFPGQSPGPTVSILFIVGIDTLQTDTISDVSQWTHWKDSLVTTSWADSIRIIAGGTHGAYPGPSQLGTLSYYFVDNISAKDYGPSTNLDPGNGAESSSIPSQDNEVWPNPAQSGQDYHIRSSNNYTIVDMTGNRLYDGTGNSGQVSLPTLSKGVYFVYFFSEYGDEVKKLIVQ